MAGHLLRALFSLCLPLLAYAETLTYDKINHHIHTKIVWMMEPVPEGFLIEESTAQGTLEIRCDASLRFQGYTQFAPTKQKQYSIARKGESLIVETPQRRRPKQQVLPIGQLAWVQEFGFGLRSFVISHAKEYKFCIINPEDFSVHRMVAVKEGLERVQACGEEHMAQKVRVNLQGIQKAFWKAELWFEPSKGTLLISQYKEGPLAPLTTMTLVSKSS